MIALLAAVVGLEGCARADTIVVNPGGSIQAGIDRASTGDTVLVQAGTYTGGLTLDKSIALQAERGVTVNGNGTGRAVSIQCSDCSVVGFTFVDFESGIGADRIAGRNRVTLRNNVQRRTNYGFWISGDDWVVEGNEVDRIIRRSANGDADYARIFGNRHVISRNWFHGTRLPTDLAPGPDYAHTDCLQFYNQNGEVLRDVLIEENIFTDFVQGMFIGNETGDPSAVQRVIVRNNVFWGTTFPPANNLLGTPSWGIYFGKRGPAREIVIENNLFRNCSNAIGIISGTDAIVRRNIVANSGSVYILTGTPEIMVTTSPGGNLLFANTRTGELAAATDITNIDPQFRNVHAVVGGDSVPWTDDDGWHTMNPAATDFGPKMEADTGGGGDDDSGGSGGGGGGGCFIATAVYGTPMAAEIDSLRAVRDAYLIDTVIGAAIVDTYYRASPVVARLVAEYSLVRRVVRTVVAPIAAASRWMLASPGSTAGMGVAITMFILTAVLRGKRFLRTGRRKR